MSPQAILVGIAAGLASGLLFAGIVFQSSSAIGLAFAAPIPVAIASLGWGTAAGFVAAFTAAGLLFAATGAALSALTLLLSMTLPTAVAGHLLGLSRPAEERAAVPASPSPFAPASVAAPNPVAAPRLDWYPLPRVFHTLVLMSIAACILIGWLIGFDPASIGDDLAAALQAGGVSAEGLTPEQVVQVTRFLVDLVPLVQPAMLVMTLVAGLYIGAWATRVSGRLPRPRDDLPATARLPRVAVSALAIGLAGSFLPGALGLVASVVAGAYFAAFSLAGLAAFHRRTRGRPGRGLILVAAYGAIVVLAFPILAFTVLGIVETGRGTPARPLPPPAS